MVIEHGVNGLHLSLQVQSSVACALKSDVPLSHLGCYGYDPLKQITQWWDNLSNTTSISYDNFGP